MTEGPLPPLSSRLSKVTLRSVRGEFHRAVPESAAPYATEDGPSYRFNNRYNVAGKFGAVYLASDPEVCRATLEKRGLLANRTAPHVLLAYEADCDRILDLTDLKTLSLLNVRIEDFLKPSDQPGAYDAPQQFSAAVYEHGAINGLMVPDVTHTGNTLVLYPGRALANGALRLKGRRTLLGG